MDKPLNQPERHLEWQRRVATARVWQRAERSNAAAVRLTGAGRRLPVTHDPDLTTYDCLSCGQPWPCDPAREHLVSSLAGPSLGMRMAAEMEMAVPALRCTAPELWDRFLAWTRPGWAR